MSGYEIKTYNVVWYAETGYVYVNSIGWEHTDYSKEWPTKEEAELDLLKQPNVAHSEAYGWHRDVPYGAARVRRAEELLEGENENGY